MALKSAFGQFLDPSNRSTRQQMLLTARDPLFIPRYSISLARYQELTHQRLKFMAALGLFSPFDQKTNPTNLFTAIEALAVIDISLAVKCSMQFNLFAGTLVRLGTERHMEVAIKAAAFQAVGGFAMTEIGHGTNAVGLETTATWSNGEFVIHSPSVSSHKFWVSNTAHSAQWVVLLWELVIGGKNEGVHPFLVRIRQENGAAAPG
jgi:acyl-CoA oxidase